MESEVYFKGFGGLRMGRTADLEQDGVAARMYSGGATLAEIGRMLGVSPITVRGRLKRLGLWTARSRRKGGAVVQDLGDGVGLVNANAFRALGGLPGADLMVTSPPYDAMRSYGGFVGEFDFGLMADEIVRNLADGGVLVWVMMDQIRGRGETGSSFRQALGFQERGLTLWHTLIWEKWNVAGFRARDYYRTHEYMFVFCKGDQPKGGEVIKDRAQTKAGKRSPRKSGFGRVADEKPVFLGHSDEVVPEFGLRGSVWRIPVGRYHMEGEGEELLSEEHPAAFPYALARDHILSWSDVGDLVIDPMAGSGTVLRAARDLGRRAIGIEVNTGYCGLIRRRLGK